MASRGGVSWTGNRTLCNSIPINRFLRKNSDRRRWRHQISERWSTVRFGARNPPRYFASSGRRKFSFSNRGQRRRQIHSIAPHVFSKPTFQRPNFPFWARHLDYSKTRATVIAPANRRCFSEFSSDRSPDNNGKCCPTSASFWRQRNANKE